MADSPSEPDWSLLPHRPEEFFDLAGQEYDRKELKRRYSRLLKRYKPEKFPEEFQRIRAAYEQLDNQLRYDLRLNSGPAIELPQGGWNELTSPDKSSSRTTGSPESSQLDSQSSPAVPKIWERVNSESPATLYLELHEKTNRTAYDYYCLAILGDILPDRDDTTLFKWILEGISTHPEDSALFRLLYQLLRQDHSPELCRKLIKAVSKSVRDDRFYMLTEPLWNRLLQEDDFKSVARLLETCESNLKGVRVDGQTAFYMYLIRRSIFRASTAWLTQALQRVEENHSSLHGRSEVELEVLNALLSYRQRRSMFLDGTPLFHELDAVIVAYCESDDQLAERLYLNLQVQLASGEWDVQAAFPSVSDPAIDAFFEAWLWIDADISSRFGIEEVEVGSNLRRRSVSITNLLRTIDLKTRRKFRGKIWNSLGWLFQLSRLFIVILVIAAGVILFQLELIPLPGQLAAFLFVPFIVVNIFAVRWFSKAYLLPCFRGLNKNMSAMIYDLVWRNELEQYLRQTALPYPMVLKLIRAVSDEDDRLSNTIIENGFNDVGLNVFSISMKYLS